MNYLVADFIVRVKNAYLARRQSVVLPFSTLTLAIGKVLVKEGMLASIKEDMTDNKKILHAELRYVRRRPALTQVRVISKPSLRVYVDFREVVTKYRDAVLSVVSTSQGIMSGKEAAKKKVGGELLFSVW
ncbi:MAG: 30S ribosomal protein S8 [Candidatus Levybacteria bacterium]|nr:30S ribosomal protein S8 [Candidatus Levybacteria bacterium]